MTGYNPDSWLDILGLVILGLAFVGAAAIPAWLTVRRQRGVKDKVNEMHDQVVNNHGDRNLRVDIDRLLALGEANATGLADLREKVGEIRGEVRGLTDRVNHLNK
jgi:hypothetical protein